MDEKDRAFQAERIHMNNLLDEEKAINSDLTERLDAATEANERLLTQLDDKDAEIDKLKHAFDQMKAACEKKAAKWLIKQIGGGGHD